MRFIFRPLTSYAVHTRKWCRDIAAGIKGNGLVRRVLDGFLIQVTKRNGTAIADVIDVDGVLVTSLNATLAAFTLRRWMPAKKLICGGNPTRLGAEDTNPVFDEFATLEGIAPSGYVGTVPWPGPGPFPSAGAVMNTACAPTLGNSSLVSAHVIDSTCIISRLGAACATDATAESILDLPLPEDNNAQSARFIGLPASAFGFSAAITNPAGEFQHPKYIPVFATCAWRSGFVGVVGSVIGSSVGVPLGAKSPPDELSVLRYTLEVDPVTGVTTVSTTPVFFFTEADADEADRSVDTPAFNAQDHLPPLDFGDGSWRYTATSGFKPGIPAAVVPFYTNIADWPAPWEIVAAVRPDIEHYETMPAPTAVQVGDTLTMVFSVRAERQSPPVTAHAVASTNPAKTGYVDCPSMPILREAMYYVRIADGTASVTRIHSTSVSVTEPASWNNQYVQHYPAAVVFSDAGPTFLCQKVSTRSETQYRGGEAWRYACPGYRVRSEDTGLSAILPGGTIIDVGTPGRYPAGYHTVDGYTGGAFAKYDDDDDVRWNFGRRFGSNWDYRGEYETSACDFACHYAPGMALVVMGDTSAYRERLQLVRLVVVRVATGEVVAETEPLLAMDTSPAGRDQPYVRWHVTCLEEGKVDDEGELTHHAIVLLTMSYRYAAGGVFVVKDLSTVQQVCVTEAAPIHGPVYYLGTPLAPAKVGRSTGRTFLKGKPVTP